MSEVRIGRDEDYPPESLGAEVQRICNEADEATPGLGDIMLASWNAKWELMAGNGLRTTLDATR